MGQHVRQGRGNHPLGIGVAGCGRMGKPMLASLRRAEFDAAGFDLRSGLGTGIGTDAAAFAKPLKTLITVVRDAGETDALLFKDQALLEYAPNLETLLICSTLSPVYVVELRGRVAPQIAVIDAPMSGASVRAEAGTLSFMLGGDPEAIDLVMPLLSAMGQTFHNMGPLGAGMTSKVLNNLLAASSTVMTRLVLDWADAAGVDETKLLSLIDSASGQNWLASGFDDIEFARDGYAADNSIGILAKDVTAALDIAPEGVDISLPEVVRSQLCRLAPRQKT